MQSGIKRHLTVVSRYTEPIDAVENRSVCPDVMHKRGSIVRYIQRFGIEGVRYSERQL